MERCQEELCQILASSSPQICRVEEIFSLCIRSKNDEVINKVTPIFHPNEDLEHQVKVTPLMVACDKLEIRCLSHLESKVSSSATNELTKNALINIVGNPLHRSTDCENTALHYAAMSGFGPAFRILGNITTAMTVTQRADDQDNALRKELGLSTCFADLLSLISQQNGHNDTPIMMACAMGHIKMLLSWMDELANVAKLENMAWKQMIHEFTKLCKLSNDAGDTLLSIAYGHGHPQILKFIIQEVAVWGHRIGFLNTSETEVNTRLVEVTYEDMEKCRDILKRVDIIQNSSQTEQVEVKNKNQSYKTLQEGVSCCLALLEEELAKNAQRCAEELLLEESDCNTHLNSNRSFPKKCGKKKKKSKCKSKKIEEKWNSCCSSDNLNLNHETGMKSKNVIPRDSGVVLERDERGDQQPSNKQSYKLCNRQSQTVEAVSGINRHLFERCVADSSIVPSKSENEDFHEFKSIMESLCVDASMLLLTPHAMAMNLSPSQLEVVEKVLNNQIHAVTQAKVIHKRLLSA